MVINMGQKKVNKDYDINLKVTDKEFSLTPMPETPLTIEDKKSSKN